MPSKNQSEKDQRMRALRLLEEAPADLGRRAATAVPHADADPTRPAYIIVLSGSLNPLHKSHVALLHAAVTAMESKGHVVLAALLVPSSHSYVVGKLGAAAIPLVTRVDMCRAACRDDGAEYLGVAPWGYASGTEICARVETQITKSLETINGVPPLAHRFPTIRALAVYGSDFLVRCPGCMRKPTLIVARKDDEGTALKAKELLAQSADKIHPSFVYLDINAAADSSEVPELSSTRIRQVAHAFIVGNATEAITIAHLEAMMSDGVIALYMQHLRDRAAANAEASQE